MDRFRSVLVLANAERPLAHKLETATRLARRNRAPLTLFDAVTVPRLRLPGTAASLTEELVADRRAQLDDVAASLDVDDVRVTVTAGDAVFVETIREVVDRGHDIVVTAPDEPGRSRLAGAPTVLHLLRKCPVPVWVTVAGSESRRGVVAAIGPFVEETAELNRTLLELASSVAQRHGEPLELVTVHRLEGETLLRRPNAGMAPEEVDALVARSHAAASDALAALADEVVPDDVETTTHVVHGRVVDVLPDAVAHLAPRTLVLGTLSRTGISGMIVGNTAERVFGTVECSVLAVKPPGFVSPVV